MSVNGCGKSRKAIRRADSKSTYMIMRQYDAEGIFQKLICCSAVGVDISCKDDMPKEIDFLIGLYPDRHSTLIKCCHTENVIDRTEPDK